MESRSNKEKKKSQLHELGVAESRKRKRDTNLCKEVAAMNLAGLKLQRDLMQIDEKDSTPTSMGVRFIALTQVNEATNGLDHKIAHALIKYLNI